VGGFLGIGGSSAKTDRAFQLDAMTKLKNVFNYALPQAESTTAAGTSDLGAASGYWQKLLSGNRATLNQAVAPETNAVRSGADARKRQLASSGTARGGGTSATSQQIDTDTMAKVDNLLFGARPEAAKETAKIGSTEAGLGANLLGASGTTATNLADIAMKSRGQSYAINQDTVGKVTQAIDAVVAGVFA
jgi:hypothetical protein